MVFGKKIFFKNFVATNAVTDSNKRKYALSTRQSHFVPSQFAAPTTFRKKNAPTPGFEPGMGNPSALKADAIPDYATLAVFVTQLNSVFYLNLSDRKRTYFFV